MKIALSTILSAFILSLISSSVFSAGDEDNIQKLSSFKSTGGGRGEVIPQDSRFADNIRKNILPNIKVPSGFKIELFAVAPDARNMAISRNKGAVWIGTRKSKVWQATDRDMDNVADIEDNLVDVDMSQYDVYEEVEDIPEDDNVEEYETVVIEDEDDGHGVDPTDILETGRKSRGFRGKRGNK